MWQKSKVFGYFLWEEAARKRCDGVASLRQVASARRDPRARGMLLVVSYILSMCLLLSPN